jgi:hypothetical protein
MPTIASLLPEGAERLAPLIRRRIGNVTRSTLLRWAMKGVRGTDGQVVKLKAWRIGSSIWYSTAEAVDDFLAAITICSVPADAPQVRSPRERQRASSAAKAELKKLGL